MTASGDRGPEQDAEIVAELIRRLSAERLLMASAEALASELESWLGQLELAGEGDVAAAHELHKQVAFHARELGLEARPASAVVMQFLLLEDLLRERGWPERHREIARGLVRVAADAFALGQEERLRDKQHKEIKNFTPILRLTLGEKTTVIGFLLGPMSSDLIDAAVGRWLREIAGSGATVGVLDVFGAGPEDDRFYRTLESVLAKAPGAKLAELVLTGLRDPEATREALASRKLALGPLSFHASLNHWLAGV